MGRLAKIELIFSCYWAVKLETNAKDNTTTDAEVPLLYGSTYIPQFVTALNPIEFEVVRRTQEPLVPGVPKPSYE